MQYAVNSRGFSAPLAPKVAKEPQIDVYRRLGRVPGRNMQQQT